MLKKVCYIFRSMRDAIATHFCRKEYRFADRLAQKGDKNGQYILAMQYEEGNIYLKRNRVNSYVLYYMAAQQGLKRANEALQKLEAKLPIEQLQKAKGLIKQIEGEREQVSIQQDADF